MGPTPGHARKKALFSVFIAHLVYVYRFTTVEGCLLVCVSAERAAGGATLAQIRGAALHKLKVQPPSCPETLPGYLAHKKPPPPP